MKNSDEDDELINEFINILIAGFGIAGLIMCIISVFVLLSYIFTEIFTFIIKSII